MINYIRYFFLSVIFIIFILILRYSFDDSLEKTKADFLTNEMHSLEELSKNISNAVISEVVENRLYYTLSGDPELRKILEKNLEIIISEKYKYAYIVHRDIDGNFRILLDGAKEDKAIFNEPLGVINASWEDAYKNKLPTYFKEEAVDSIWLTYLYPIVIDNETQAILAIDFSIDEIQKTLEYFDPIQNLLQYILYAFIATVALILILLTLWYSKNKEVSKHQEMIKENEAFYKALLDSQSNIIVTFSYNRILNANQRFFDFFNIPDIGSFYQKYDRLYDCFEMFNDQSYLRKNPEWIKEVIHETNKMHKVKIFNRIFAVTGQSIIQQEEKIDIIVFSDVTDLEKAQINAMDASKAKSDFLANMSHEIRTPMNAIIGLTDLTLKSKLTKKQSGYLEKIQSSADSLLRIVNDILDFSKIEAGKMSLEDNTFSIFQLINKARQLFDTQSNINDVQFEIFVDPLLPKAFIGDMGRLEQIIINLLSNAFKFTKNGSVELHLRSLPKHSDYNLSIEVKDTGLGIKKEKIPTLFNSFTQADSSTTRKFGGTGLGLSITKKLVDLFHGEITVNSQEGLGSNFTVLLHLDEGIISNETQKSQHEDKMIEELKRYKDINIMVAEDNHINQDVICGYLENFDIFVNVVGNGQECLDNYNNDVDLILMDINMPVLNGYEATRQLKEQDSKTPIIALSANARQEDHQLSKQNGMVEHIAKPIEPSILYATLLRYLPEHKKTRVPHKSTPTIPEKTSYPFKTINAEKIISRFHDNHELFDKILFRFYDDYATIFDKINSFVNTNDEESLKELFHKYSSTSGTIGANKLFQCVKTIYLSMQEGTFDKNELTKLSTLHKEVLDEIKCYRETYQEKERSNNDTMIFTNRRTVQNHFFILQESLQQADIKKIKQVLDVFEGLILKKEDAALLESIKSAVNLYDFQAALQCYGPKDMK